MISVGVPVSCYASEYKDIKTQEIFLIVIDSSKETYGTQLKNEVYSQLRNQLKVSVNKESEIKHQSVNSEISKINWAEKAELLELANQTGSNQILVVEILPSKSDFSDILIYKSIKSEATLRIRLFDAVKKQYILTEEVAGTGVNKTYIPYTSVGKKTTVWEAVQNATKAAAREINQSEESR
jgi:CRISPR/Cas system-associated exonuclease Cas4 (RecB family)